MRRTMCFVNMALTNIEKAISLYLEVGTMPAGDWRPIVIQDISAGLMRSPRSGKYSTPLSRIQIDIIRAGAGRYGCERELQGRPVSVWALAQAFRQKSGFKKWSARLLQHPTLLPHLWSCHPSVCSCARGVYSITCNFSGCIRFAVLTSAPFCSAAGCLCGRLAGPSGRWQTQNFSCLGDCSDRAFKFAGDADCALDQLGI